MAFLEGKIRLQVLFVLKTQLPSCLWNLPQTRMTKFHIPVILNFCSATFLVTEKEIALKLKLY